MRPLRLALLLAAFAAARTVAQPPPEPPTPALPVPTRTLVTALIAVLGDLDGEVRLSAAVALANVGAEAVEPLTATLSDKNSDARASAAYGLGLIGGPAAPATEALIKALKDEEREVRRQAAQALARIVAGTKPQSATGEPRSLAPPVPIDAPPPVFPPVK
jgi:HEAT repeat protein